MDREIVVEKSFFGCNGLLRWRLKGCPRGCFLVNGLILGKVCKKVKFFFCEGEYCKV